ncbi:hypothetical protein [Streptomyces sp. NPDC058295]|uniref:hypothetical protein n=1 Tax=Streptomyces sp. NPDC058295 TaxID=3346431 RepID=UPI0036E13C7C
MAQLNSTVYVQDPHSHQTVELAAGTSPEARLAALVTNPAAWVDGKLPRLPKAKTDSKQEGDGDPTGDGQDDASGDNSEASADADQADPPAKKTAARKTAANKPARGRDAAAEGTSGD